MDIIIPPHHKIAVPVKNYKEIRKDAELMVKLVDGRFKGHWKSALAISHAQVSENPKTFFALNIKYALYFKLPRIVINPKIIRGWDEKIVKEGCMDFQKEKAVKIKRFNKVEVEYLKPTFFGLKPMRGEFEDIMAWMFQHELLHFEGKNIYDR